ncbi:MAG: NAD+ synthase [Phycisphaerae bacterium]|nr:MAG: NAD+ synthase [Phycisphaerae bacterium]
MLIALAQINPTVGDIDGNCAKICSTIETARAKGADLVLFPELCVPGYPPRDMLLRKDFVQRNVSTVETIATACKDIIAVIGFASPNNDAAGKELYNAAAVCQNGRILTTYRKRLLPTYDVFDESRYFASGDASVPIPLTVSGETVRLGVTICEDLWNDEPYINRQLYGADPIADLANQGVDLIVNISASPFSMGKQRAREELFSRQVAEHGIPLALVNQVGGNDELIFDGASAFFDASGKCVMRTESFVEDLKFVDTECPPTEPPIAIPDDVDAVHRALVLGTRDYVGKCGFSDVVIGLSGGIDSAVTAAIAVEALGKDHVHGVAMPSRISSDHSVDDAEQLSINFGIDHRVIPINEIHQSAEKTLAEDFAGTSPGVAEENIQARARGGILMALSNKFGWLLLTTGNKSELAVGYCTLYGDMCGGLAVISDVPKMMVYAIARFINESAGKPLIPQNTIDKVPSAELRENQTDQDSLPPYETLDAILQRYVEHDMDVAEIVSDGFDRDLVVEIARKVDRNEYKRKQAATGLKVTSRAFGTGRRMPIAAKYTY